MDTFAAYLRFAAIVGHDLLSPLRSLATIVLDASRHVDDPKLTQKLEKAQVICHQLMAFADELVTTRDYLQQHNAFEETDLQEIVKRVLVCLSRSTADAQATIVVRDLPVVSGDPVQLSKVFQNLIDNAIKYRGAEAPCIEIDTAPRRREWLITIADNGIGVNPAFADSLFRFGKRLHGAEIPGWGIGLATCRRIIENHGGRVWICPHRSHRGTLVCITLPRSR